MATTISLTEILQPTIESFKVKLPALQMFNPVFLNQAVKKGSTVRAHVPTLPAASTYDATTGYENGATDSQSLFTDLDVTLDQLSHVPVKLDYLNQIASNVSLFQRACGDIAFVLAKTVVDYALGKVLAANFSRSTTKATADVSKDQLDAICQDMNEKGAGAERFGVVNSGVYTSLEADTRIASKDFSGQTRQSSPWGRLVNIAGFQEIVEYPALPANSENLTGFFFDRRALSVVTAIPATDTALAGAVGIPQVGRTEIVTDPTTGLSMLGIMWQKSGTFDVYVTIAVLYDCVAGKNGGSAAALTDYAGHRLVSA